MELPLPATPEPLPPNPIRVETALSRYPVHRLAKQGDDVPINIREESADGELSIKWEVNYINKYGQPGPLAYKLDTLIINRRIEEATRPIPRIIKLGSLRDICQELGLSQGENINCIRTALRQNAFTAITAKIRYRLNNGSQRTLDADFIRYSVVITGEKLPNGRKADAVYIILNEIYRSILNEAVTRPLDYDYLKSLPPVPQRFYELLSYQIYAALKFDRTTARLTYSEFCVHAPQTRYLEWWQVRNQMTKIHRPHEESGYIAKVEYEETIDKDGNPDWIMLYEPGPKAKAEFQAFAKRGKPASIEFEPFINDPLPLFAAHEPSPLEKELIDHGVTAAIAADLVRDHDAAKIRQQIEILEWKESKKPGKIAEPGGWLVSAIKTGHATPKGFVSAADRQKQQEAQQLKERAAAEEHRREQEAKAQARREKALVDAYWNNLSKEQKAAHEAAAIAQANAEELKLIESGPLKRAAMANLRDSYTRKLVLPR